jgi:hypothetical protein
MLVLAVLGCAAGAFVVTSVFARSTAAPGGLLGADWECEQLFLVTSCTRLKPAMPASRDHREPHQQATNLPRV